MSRIAETFAGLAGASDGNGSGRRAAYIAYATAGFPDVEGSLDIMRAMLASADMLEIGVPFSDPTMDGPVIQETSRRALESGMHLGEVLHMTESLRLETDKPLLIMSYFNPIHAMGLRDFAAAAADAGVDGVILPDLPLEEFVPWGEVASACGLDTVLFVAMTSSPERMRAAGAHATGFIYALASMGTTGLRTSLSERLAPFLEQVRRESGMPVAAGVGISSPEQCREVGRAADGVIVGTALMQAALRAVDEGEDPARAVRDIISPMVSALTD